MLPRERLMATLHGLSVDRVPVSFYEINGLDENPADPHPFNIYSHPSWKPVLDLAREKTDRIVMRTVQVPRKGELHRRTRIEEWLDGPQLFRKVTVQANSRTLTSLSRRDQDVNTVWQIEHLLKDKEDLIAYIDLPFDEISDEIKVSEVLEAEEKLGESGIIMLDTPDPLCIAASLFDLGTFTVIASQEENLFRKLLDRFSKLLEEDVELISKALPGYLWRIYGPEYASPPYLHPRLFADYVINYDQRLVKIIQENQGFARIHSHGRLGKILGGLVGIGIDALDPIEPPPQGDVELIDVRMKYGDRIVLFGNLEASDLEILPKENFEKKIRRALHEGTHGNGRGFVLMPSACPYGRVIEKNAVENYFLMVEMIERCDY